MNNYLPTITFAFLLLLTGCKKSKESETPQVIDQKPATELDRPIYVSATKGKFGNRIVVTWAPIPKAKKYQLFKLNESTQEYVLTKETTDTTFTDLQITKPLTKVYYKVMVRNSDTEYSKFSDLDYGYTSGQNYVPFLSFGTEGAGQGQFSFVNHLEVDKDNNIYVSDEGNNVVHKFNQKGTFLERFYNGQGARGIVFLNNGNVVVTQAQYSNPYVKIMDKQKNVLKGWGTYGSADNQFLNIEEITTDDDQNIYVVDGSNNLVKKFDQNGNFLLKFPGAVRAPGQQNGPYPFGICFFKNKIFVTSPRNGQVRVYDKAGNYIKTWNTGASANAIKGKGDHLYIACGGSILKTDEDGLVKEDIGRSEIAGGHVSGIAVNSDGDIIALNVSTRKVIIFKQL